LNLVDIREEILYPQIQGVTVCHLQCWLERCKSGVRRFITCVPPPPLRVVVGFILFVCCLCFYFILTMTGAKTQTDKDKGPKPTGGECLSNLKLKEMMRVFTKAFESHTIDADLSPSGSIYLSFSSFVENIANEDNESELSMDKIFARRRICDRRKIKL
jgi:hypothetical protein